MGMGEGFQDLCACLDRVRVSQLSVTQRLAQSPACDVFVGDIDMAIVSFEVEGSQAPRVAKPGRGLHLSLGSRPSFAFSGDDFERDITSEALVPYEPDRTGPPAAERSKRPVAAKDEMVVVEGDGALHRPPALGDRLLKSCYRRGGW
jgi:hypothetical protein